MAIINHFPVSEGGSVELPGDYLPVLINSEDTDGGVALRFSSTAKSLQARVTNVHPRARVKQNLYFLKNVSGTRGTQTITFEKGTEYLLEYYHTSGTSNKTISIRIPESTTKVSVSMAETTAYTTLLNNVIISD